MKNRLISSVFTAFLAVQSTECWKDTAFVTSTWRRHKTRTPSSVDPRSAPRMHSRRRHLTALTTTSLPDAKREDNADKRRTGFFGHLASFFSRAASSKLTGDNYVVVKSEKDKKFMQLLTFFRVMIPSILAAALATLTFPALALLVATMINDAGAFAVLSQDSSQFVQNFLNVSSLLFSILVGQTYYFLYTQQESIYYALFNEVTEAKSLLEQVALVCQGRSMYPMCLNSISRYVQTDLKRINSDPALLLSARPVDDPLESIMYMTSVGVPSTVYETVKSLREARARRLGALQRKLPWIHMLLLWILAAIELISFPLLGAGTQTIGGYNVLTVEGILFGTITGGIVLTLRIVGELWRPAGGAYNVDSVLSVMVSGLEEELRARMSGLKVKGASTKAPSAAQEDKRALASNEDDDE